jgi:hypothetical protein
MDEERLSLYKRPKKTKIQIVKGRKEEKKKQTPS